MYIKHYQIEHNENTPPEFKDAEKYLCPHCPKIYFNKQQLSTHVYSKHKIQEEGSEVKPTIQSKLKQFECEKCEITISGKQEYANHCRNVE